jgi:acylphosphatase
MAGRAGKIPLEWFKLRSMSQVHHEIVYFTGRVQGVGFRYAALQVAKEYDVSGFVANCADGRVQLEAEGLKEEVDAFISAVGERMQDYIRKAERIPGSRPPHFTGFTIEGGLL